MRPVEELLAAAKAWPVWGSIAQDDVAGRYRRSVLGPLWLVLSQAGFITGLYLLHREVFGSSATNFLLWLAISLPVWGLIYAFVVDGANSIQRAKSYLESYPLPPAVFVLRTVAASLVTFAHLLVVLVIPAVLAPPPIGLATLAVVPGLAIVILFGLGAGLLLGALGARYHDVPLALPTVMNLLFVLTPVFWVPTPQQAQSPLVLINPLYHLLEVVRAPLLGGWGTDLNWIVASVTAVGTLLVGAVVFSRMRPTLIYWL